MPFHKTYFKDYNKYEACVYGLLFDYPNLKSVMQESPSIMKEMIVLLNNKKRHLTTQDEKCTNI